MDRAGESRGALCASEGAGAGLASVAGARLRAGKAVGAVDEEVAACPMQGTSGGDAAAGST